MTAQPSMFSVYDGQRCLGFLLQRGKSGVEAFDAQERSLGLFPTLKEAADAISTEIKQLEDEIPL